MHILIRTRKIAATRALIRHALDHHSGPETIFADVDPVEMM